MKQKIGAAIIKDGLLFFIIPVALCMGLAWFIEADAWPLSGAALGGIVALILMLTLGNKNPDKDNEQGETSYRDHLPELYRKQGGWGGQRAACNGCRERYLQKDFHIDHIRPQADGGGHEIENLQLLCANCNNRKGKGTMADLRESLRADGIIQ